MEVMESGLVASERSKGRGRPIVRVGTCNNSGNLWLICANCTCVNSYWTGCIVKYLMFMYSSLGSHFF